MVKGMRMAIVVGLNLEEMLMGFNLEGASGSKKSLGTLQATAARKNSDGVISFPGRNRIGAAPHSEVRGRLVMKVFASRLVYENSPTL
jgi:hypothetical protein